MPTDDDRRYVTKMLRQFADDYEEGSPAYVLCCDLADLIEPEERTCRVIMKWDGLDGSDPVCSKCGTYFDDKKWHEQKFCPNCGARVTHDA